MTDTSSGPYDRTFILSELSVCILAVSVTFALEDLSQ
jgi:hypothetical protein